MNNKLHRRPLPIDLKTDTPKDLILKDANEEEIIRIEESLMAMFGNDINTIEKQSIQAYIESLKILYRGLNELKEFGAVFRPDKRSKKLQSMPGLERSLLPLMQSARLQLVFINDLHKRRQDLFSPAPKPEDLVSGLNDADRKALMDEFDRILGNFPKLVEVIKNGNFKNK